MFAACCLLCVVGRCSLVVVCWLSRAVYWLMFDVCCLMVGVCCMVDVVCDVLFVI